MGWIVKGLSMLGIGFGATMYWAMSAGTYLVKYDSPAITPLFITGGVVAAICVITLIVCLCLDRRKKINSLEKRLKKLEKRE